MRAASSGQAGRGECGPATAALAARSAWTKSPRMLGGSCRSPRRVPSPEMLQGARKVTVRSRWAPDLPPGWRSPAQGAVDPSRQLEDVYGIYTGCAGCFNASVWRMTHFAAGFVALIGVSRAMQMYARLVIALVAAAGSSPTSRISWSDCSPSAARFRYLHYARTRSLVTLVPCWRHTEWRLPNAEALMATLCAVAGISRAELGASRQLVLPCCDPCGRRRDPASEPRSPGWVKNLWQVNAEIDPMRGTPLRSVNVSA